MLVSFLSYLLKNHFLNDRNKLNQFATKLLLNYIPFFFVYDHYQKANEACIDIFNYPHFEQRISVSLHLSTHSGTQVKHQHPRRHRTRAHKPAVFPAAFPITPALKSPQNWHRELPMGTATRPGT